MKSFKNRFLSILVSLIVITTSSFIFNPHHVSAQTPTLPLTGWAWSSTIGWISLNQKDVNGNALPGSSAAYGINIAGTGNLIGYGWSEHIGWIEATSNNGCVSGGGNQIPRINGYSSNATTPLAVSGWLKAIAGTGNNLQAGGWNGCIVLSGTQHPSNTDGIPSPNTTPLLPGIGGGGIGINPASWQGVTYYPNVDGNGLARLVGWGWGGLNVGWVFFDGFIKQPPQPLEHCADPTASNYVVFPPSGSVANNASCTYNTPVSYCGDPNATNFFDPNNQCPNGPGGWSLGFICTIQQPIGGWQRDDAGECTYPVAVCGIPGYANSQVPLPQGTYHDITVCSRTQGPGTPLCPSGTTYVPSINQCIQCPPFSTLNMTTGQCISNITNVPVTPINPNPPGGGGGGGTPIFEEI